MYVGHSLLAFTLAAVLARAVGARDRTVLVVGAAAAGFALVPDVDSAYTVWTVLRAGPSTVFPTTEYVWTAEGWFVHRSLTHSLLVGIVAVAMTLIAAEAGDRRGVGRVVRYGLAGSIGAGLVAVGFRTDGGLGVATMALYVAAALGVAGLARRAALAPRHVGAAAAIGLLTHPFGDVFMGRPPAFLYPVLTEPTVAKVAVAPDPTVNLIGLFAIELGLAWCVVWIVARHTGRSLGPHVGWRATLGFGFAGAVLFIRPPTLAVAYHFTLATIATGVVVGVAPTLVNRPSTRPRYLSPAATGLAAVTLAVVGYLAAYLVLGA